MRQTRATLKGRYAYTIIDRVRLDIVPSTETHFITNFKP